MYTKIIIGSNCEEDYEWYGNISIDLKFKSLVIIRKFHELTWLFSWAMKNIIWPKSRKQNEQKHGGTEMGKDRVMFEEKQMYTKSMDRSRARKRSKNQTREGQKGVPRRKTSMCEGSEARQSLAPLASLGKKGSRTIF